MNAADAATAQEDAERIRLKRLAKLQGAAASSSGTSAPASAPVTPPPQPKPSLKPPVSTPLKRLAETPPPVVAPKKKTLSPLDVDAWEHETIGQIFHVTLDRQVAEQSGYDIVWLKHLAADLQAEEPQRTAFRLNGEIIDRLLISRLELDPATMTDDLDFLPVLASLPPQQTTFEYLVGCWKRVNSARSALMKKVLSIDVQNALNRLEKVRELVISYTGLTLQEPEMFPQPSGRPLGPPELVAPLLSLSSLSGPLLGSSSSSSPNTLTPSDIDVFFQDLTRRFEPDNEIDGVLGPVVHQLLFHESLFRPEGLGGGDAGWRGVVGGLEALVSIKGIAVMITRMEEFNPPNATAATFERVSLLGPLCRLGIFVREWPGIALAYFSNPDKRSRDDIESSFASLRGTLKSLQSSLFQIFNTLVRASPESREAVLEYFARVVSLNVKRAGMQVEPDTVATDSFMVNLQSVLLRFAEPFMDANYTKRINLDEETRIKATSEEATKWAEEQQDPNAPPPNFVSNIFYLAVAMSHYGILRTISSYSDLAKHLDDMQRHLDMLQGMATPMQTHEQAINHVTVRLSFVQSTHIINLTGDNRSRWPRFACSNWPSRPSFSIPELVFRSIGFTNFLSTWLIRQVDPAKKHPNPPAKIPLPKEVPMAFRVLPEYILEDIVDYLHFIVQTSPDKFDLSGKTELLIFVLTFLNSTWYIKNPFLKSKINDVLFFGIWGYGRERNGLLGNMLNTHPMALKHLMPALTHFYIEVEQTGASSQFYDKFSARRNISYILKVVWDNPTHREALNSEAARDGDKFVRFVNLMINDVTYLMDESLSELTQIHTIQQEMDDQAAWNARPAQVRREREGTLRTLERHASGYISLGRSTVELLKVFTAELKTPFMMPEIVDRLAAMLDYNLHALIGPKYRDLEVRDREKLKFNPKALLSDIIQVFLNLSDQEEFIKAVAGDGRSYSQELFERAAQTAVKRSLKTTAEVEQLRAFVAKVEECRLNMEAEEDLGEVPDEFLDPLMFTVMRDPVLLPSSRAIVDRATIKSHLLSDRTDPFNRMPLSIEEVIPDTALKARIDAFLIERRSKPAQVTPLPPPEAEVAEAMDTT
ncbi:U-box domain-containing protein [Mycena sanguinolenta]|uniref:RING-type E3 ubiquitin transferase n=1 Tax=Mycena sanguinolenta TaxID=230812 RepID=A0A8H6XTM1_9AGAR|nr:U-box domain-containing protein [Mycena sanguinolenta]